MSPLRYLTPFIFLALVPLGMWLGGAWTFAAVIATPLCLVGLDAALGKEAARTGATGEKASRWPPRIYIILQLAVMAWVAAWVAARPGVALLETVGLTASTGLTAGVFGFLAAHEMIHSRDRRERALGLLFLASVFYMHFRIAHIYGHHRRASTVDDPASARLGEGLYAFLLRSVVGQFREAWAFEAQRQRRSGRPAFGPENRMIAYLAIEVSLLLAIALMSGRALAFLVATSVIAVALLEGFNYVAHYGLNRPIGAGGRAERLEAKHAWNSSRRMNNAALFNMGRHSDHHRRTTSSYDRLTDVAGAAELPWGYAGAMLMAIVPPLWRRAMDPRVEAAMAERPRPSV